MMKVSSERYSNILERIYLDILKKSAKAPDRVRDQLSVRRIVLKYRELQDEILESYHLSDQEKLVAKHILCGISYSHIAKLLILTESTISFHAHNIMKKCRVDNRNDLCLLIMARIHLYGRTNSQAAERPKRSNRRNG